MIIHIYRRWGRGGYPAVRSGKRELLSQIEGPEPLHADPTDFGTVLPRRPVTPPQSQAKKELLKTHCCGKNETRVMSPFVANHPDPYQGEIDLNKAKVAAAQYRSTIEPVAHLIRQAPTSRHCPGRRIVGAGGEIKIRGESRKQNTTSASASRELTFRGNASHGKYRTHASELGDAK